tara:strand:- start:79 stop:636 length:558 start_codon:yes stop_codon:yes gene_type:complete
LTARLIKNFLNNNQEGFTLVELVVVVVIIGFLSAISIPSFRKIHYKADEAEAQVLANSIIKATAIIYTRDGVMPNSWSYIASEIPSLKFCKYQYARNRTCGKYNTALLPVTSINAAINPMNCIVVTNASYELCGRRNINGFSLVMKEFVHIAQPSIRKSISACLGNNGSMRVVKQKDRNPVWMNC